MFSKRKQSPGSTVKHGANALEITVKITQDKQLSQEPEKSIMKNSKVRKGHVAGHNVYPPIIAACCLV